MHSMAQLFTDFKRFKDEPSLATRERITMDICVGFNQRSFKDSEAEIVKDILRYLARDVEVTVRKSLAETLKHNMDLPHDIALSLAQDVEEVSVPILEFAGILTDEDLENIISSAIEVAKLTAIARRKTVSEHISGMLIDTENELVAEALIANKGASIHVDSLQKMVQVFRESENVLSSLINRGGLSVGLAEQMVSMVSARLQKQLVTQYGVNAFVSERTVRDARESATLAMAQPNPRRSTTLDLVTHLMKTGKLSHSIVLRALCRGDLDFFEASLAQLAGISHINASKLIHRGDRRGFAALFAAANMPSTMLEATETLLRVIAKNPQKQGEPLMAYSRRLIESIVEGAYDKNVPNMRYFMALINSCAVDSPVTLH